MRVELSTILEVTTEIAWGYVQRSDLLDYIAAPLIRFRPRAGSFPARWEPGEYPATMYLFGVVPIGRQTIGIEFPEPPEGTFVLRDNGHGTLIRKWDHWIFIEANGRGTRYTDRVDIEAGVLTPFVAAFARLFYGHRQRRWKRLVARNFAQLTAA